MNRNFNNESSVNFLLRAIRAFNGRLRGKLLFYLRAFATGSHSKIFFGKGVRLLNSKSILLEKNVNFGIMARLECYNLNNKKEVKITIGKGTSFGDYLHMGATNNIKLGSNILGGSNILIIDHNHGQPKKDLLVRNKIPPRYREITSKGRITIEDNVWIGDNVVILGGVRIGKGSIISAGSIVNKTIDVYTIY